MSTARSPTTVARFLGVRLSAEEAEDLEKYRHQAGPLSRSDAVRALVRAAAQPTPAGVELPVGLRAQLETLVEDGWARNVGEALTLVLTLGLQELSRVHAERLPKLRRAARDAADRRGSRTRADREGRGLLER